MTHVLHAHGLFTTAVAAVEKMQHDLCAEVQTAAGGDAIEAFEQLRTVDQLKNDLDFGCCLTTEARRVLIAACTLKKGTLTLIGAGALDQRVMNECDKIIKLAA